MGGPTGSDRETAIVIFFQFCCRISSSGCLTILNHYLQQEEDPDVPSIRTNDSIRHKIKALNETSMKDDTEDIDWLLAVQGGIELNRQIWEANRHELRAIAWLEDHYQGRWQPWITWCFNIEGILFKVMRFQSSVYKMLIYITGKRSDHLVRQKTKSVVVTLECLWKFSMCWVNFSKPFRQVQSNLR